VIYILKDEHFDKKYGILTNDEISIFDNFTDSEYDIDTN